MDFSHWLFRKYLDWQAELGQRQSVTAFAAYIGVSQPQMAAYLKGDYLPKGENLGKIAAVLGAEIYDVMGMPRPIDRESPMIKWALELLDDPEIVEFMKKVYSLPEELRSPFLNSLSTLLVAVYRVEDPEKRRKIMLRLLDFEKEISDEDRRDLFG